jgi:hypothetical protein
MTLEDADAVIITLLDESLCVLLAGSDPTYITTNSSGVSVCARYGADAGAEAGAIIYQGDWCAGTNAAATKSCADSQHVAAAFAAASIKINN